ncbi:MAG: AMP-binding protein [Gammaproteobacteria bacterium]
MRSLAGWIARHAEFMPTKAAIVTAESACDYAGFAARIATLVAWLEETCGLRRGARVAWLGHNHTDQVALLFACAELELMLVPLNWRLTAHEIAGVLDDARVALVVVDRHCAGFLSDLGDRPAVTSDFDATGYARLPRATRADLPLPGTRAVDDTLPVLLVYTSGTTGFPRGAALSQRALLFNALNSLHMHDLTAADRVLNVLPMFHVGGINIQTLPALYCGATVLLAERFEPRATLALIARERPTLTVLVPPMIQALAAEPAWQDTALDSLRAVATGSTDVPRAVIEVLHARGVPVIQIYGSTETGPVAIYQRIDDAMRTVGSIGRVGLHTEVRVVDADNRDVPCGTPGQILVRGPHVATGYWNATTGQIDPFPAGWFASGDIAARDETGLFWFKDRSKYVIISGGENVYPAELERLLAECGLLREAAVAPRADARWGQVPVVVAVRGEAAVDAAAVLAVFEGRVARYKRPRDVLFVDSLPRTALGKVAVAVLRELVAAHHDG